jgi:hypothetical protein
MSPWACKDYSPVSCNDNSIIYAHACGVNQDHEDAHALQDYGYAGANAICAPKWFLHRANGYDAHRYVYDNGYAP